MHVKCVLPSPMIRFLFFRQKLQQRSDPLVRYREAQHEVSDLPFRFRGVGIVVAAALALLLLHQHSRSAHLPESGMAQFLVEPRDAPADGRTVSPPVSMDRHVPSPRHRLVRPRRPVRLELRPREGFERGSIPPLRRIGADKDGVGCHGTEITVVVGRRGGAVPSVQDEADSLYFLLGAVVDGVVPSRARCLHRGEPSWSERLGELA
mmetsp:Transcript_61541/g.181866  ORF Transcript_61541/g.181866 Transcript_61541/m.181866 type:complete len:207 (+) Transcript_61541:905-1525(+)